MDCMVLPVTNVTLEVPQLPSTLYALSARRLHASPSALRACEANRLATAPPERPRPRRGGGGGGSVRSCRG